jgi:phosphatidylglycerophosphatase A
MPKGPMNKVSRAIILFIAQGAFSGKAPIAPGTAGTVIGVLLYLGIKDLPTLSYGLITCLVCIIGIWTAGRAEAFLGKKDHPSIVIDEIAGYLISMFLVPHGWAFIIAGFFLFRIFDIIKPWPVFQLQSLHGGLGIVIDDIGAGVYTNLVLQIAALLIVR